MLFRSGLMNVFEQVRKSADLELYDETAWQQKLLDVHMRYEMGEIDAAQYEVEENRILEQLDLIASRQSDSDFDFEDEYEYDDDEYEYEEDDEEEEVVPISSPLSSIETTKLGG